jgi:hypothetical protein
MPSPEELAMMQAIGGGGEEVPVEDPAAGMPEGLEGVIQLLERLIEEGKIDPQTAEMILQAISGGSGME